MKLKDIPHILFMILIILPCKIVFESWKLYIFKKEVISRIKKFDQQSAKGYQKSSNT